LRLSILAGLMAGFVAVSVPAGPTIAADSNGGPFAEAGAAWVASQKVEDWSLSIGPGFAAVSEYPGARDTYILPIPYFELKYKDQFFASFQDGIGYNLIRTDTFKAGPVAKLVLPRKTSDAPRRLAGLPEVDMTVEAGGFVEYSAGPIEIHAEVRRGLNGHEGVIGEIGASVYLPLTTTLLIGGGPTAKFADTAYLDAYYGVPVGGAAAGRLGGYSPKSGLLSYGFSSFAALKITDKISLLGFGNYDRLQDDAANSPLVRANRGSPDQYTVGSALSYRFDFK
jgi:MipA family protein